MSLYLSIVILTCLVNIGLGLLVFLRDSRSTVTKAFFWLTIFLTGWTISNYITDNAISLEASIFFNRTAYLAGFLALFSSAVFSASFARTTFKKNYQKILAYAISGVVCVLSITDLIAGKVVYEEGEKKFILGPFVAIFTVWALLAALYIVRNFSKVLRRGAPLEKQQARIITTSIIVSILIGLSLNVIIPIFVENFNTAKFGPPFLTLFLTSTVSYAIIRHKLFDIKLVVARSAGYILSLGFLALTFAVVSTLFVDNIIEVNDNSIIATTINIIELIIAVLLYPYLKKYFDKITNKFFFRDAYDPQEFLDQLNKSIVSNIEIGILLRHTTTIIEENLKSSFVQIVIPKTESTVQKITGTNKANYSEHELNYMRGRLVGLQQKVVSLDSLNPNEDELRKIMSRRDISILVHLSATSYGQEQTIAYMIFGTKKSGNVYSKADFRIIDIIADELVIAIQNALRFEEIQDFNVTLQNKVNTATNKLRRTNEKLKTLDETKDEFISMASHQLRTPLTSVKGYLSMVLEGDAGEINENQRKLLDQAFVSSQRMVYLIADLLNVSRLRTGKFVIDAHTANLADIVEGEVSQLREQAKSKDLSLTYQKPAGFPELVLDETKTRQVVMNFVDNALYYTPAGGKIAITLKEDKNHVYFMVKDNGLGVPKDEQKHLFTKFYRAKNARSTRPDGTGLGLFMAKKVITAQGGNILFESIEGKGSTFGFSFSKKLLATPE